MQGKELITKLISLYKQYLVFLSWLLSTLITVIAGLPGWMSGDSLDMYQQAVAGVINDWHTPILIWFWSKLEPLTLGPLGPYLIQSAFLWLGIGLIMIGLYKIIGLWSALLPPLLLTFHFFSITLWVWKDNAELSLISMSIGVCILGIQTKNPKWQLVLAFLSIIFLGGILSIRWFLFPALLIAAISIALTFSVKIHSFDSDRAPKKPLFVSLMIVAFLSAGTLPLAFEKIVINPAPTGAVSVSMFLDLSRLQCEGIPGPEEDGTWIPTSYLDQGVGNICDFYNPINMEGLGWPKEPGHVKVLVREYVNNPELLKSRWFEAAASYPDKFTLSRIQMFQAYMGWADNIAPNFEVNNPVSLASFKWSLGNELGFGARGGDLLWLHRLFPSFANQNEFTKSIFNGAFFPTILIPISVWFATRKWQSKYKVPITFALFFPVIWVLNFSFVSPAPSDRYYAPAAFWGVTISLFIWGLINKLRINEE